jgi:hypothetical protein
MRKTLRFASFFLFGLGGFVPQSATAHHSFALFDANKTVRLEGTVKGFAWSNPHSWITFEVPASNDSVDQWLIELPGASTLAREGWNKNYIKVGERLILRVSPLKDGRKAGALDGFAPAGRPDISP